MKANVKRGVFATAFVFCAFSATCQDQQNDQDIADSSPKMTDTRIVKMKTNVPLLAVGVANFGIELGYGTQYTFDIPLTYSPYTIHRNYKLRIFALQPEFRYWLDKCLTGHFFGAHIHYVQFNIATDSKNRYQDDRAIWGFGLSYGYVQPLFKQWEAEFTLGGGYANISYDTYYNVYNGAKYDNNQKNYWGITRLGISLVYKLKAKPENNQ